MKNIVLTGFMGTGKTTVGFHLARELSMTFIDLDGLIEDEAGRSVSEIFSGLGEARFRVFESEAVRRVVTGGLGDGIVLATGGGAVAEPENRALLKGWGHIICLTASVETILERTALAAGHVKRPLLDTPHREAEIKRLLEERESSYSDCDMSIDTTEHNVRDVVEKIRAFVEAREKQERSEKGF